MAGLHGHNGVLRGPMAGVRKPQVKQGLTPTPGLNTASWPLLLNTEAERRVPEEHITINNKIQYSESELNKQL